MLLPAALSDAGPLAAALVFGYLLGSIPFGLIVTRLGGLGDIRAIGSGNIGATNVLRTGRRGLAAMTLLGDFGKGAVAVLIASSWSAEAAIPASLGAFLGHLYPVWLNFRGGKGVATFLGVLAGLAWPAAIAFAVIWLAVAYTSRYSSLAALTAAAATPLVLAALQNWLAVGLFTMLTTLVFLRHHQNIERLLKGEERKIGGRKA